MGHFGLALTHYAHFTSPIRRYSDLLLHRALINFLFPKEQRVDGMSREQAQQLPTMAEHISTTERRAMLAERDANERYIVHYMADHVGWTGEGVTTGVNSYGLFVTLPQTGATGFVPVSTLSDFFRYDEKLRMLMGARSGQRYGIGQKMVVRLKEANTMTGSLLMELLSAEPLPFEDILPSNSARDKRRRDEHKRGNRRYGPKDDKHGGGKKGKHKHGGNQRFKKK